MAVPGIGVAAHGLECLDKLGQLRASYHYILPFNYQCQGYAKEDLPAFVKERVPHPQQSLTKKINMSSLVT